MVRKSLFPLLLVGLLALAACNGGEQLAQAPTATLAPIVSMTPRFTATPVPSRTPLPTATYTPSTTPTPPTPTDTPPPTATPPITGIIASLQSVNVREGPGTSFRAIDALDPGTGVEVLGQSADGEWLNIQMGDGDEGWVSSDLVRLRETATPFPTLTPSPNLTALALGTPLPTAILGGGTVTPTPPLSVVSPTPVAAATDDAEATVIVAEPTEPLIPIVEAPIDISAINLTATALATSIVGQVTPITPNPAGTAGTRTPAGGPTGGPIGASSPTARPAGSGSVGSVSSQEGVDVLAYCDNPLIGFPAPGGLRAGATIDVFWSWFARTEEQLDQHAENVIYDVRVNGEPLRDWRLYAAPIQRQADGNYYEYWFVPYGPLEAGDYTVTYRVSWRQAISDGYEEFGPGTANPEETGSCTFTVE